jgi:hypothetical protein
MGCEKAGKEQDPATLPAQAGGPGPRDAGGVAAFASVANRGGRIGAGGSRDLTLSAIVCHTTYAL